MHKTNTSSYVTINITHKRISSLLIKQIRFRTPSKTINFNKTREWTKKEMNTTNIKYFYRPNFVP